MVRFHFPRKLNASQVAADWLENAGHRTRGKVQFFIERAIEAMDIKVGREHPNLGYIRSVLAGPVLMS